jgi:purine-binding chemotaxis protein CheW
MSLQHFAHEIAVAPAQIADAGECLTFRLGSKESTIDILKMQKIRSYDAVTLIPNMPGFIEGVTNLRGIIVPTVGPRLKFAVVDRMLILVDIESLITNADMALVAEFAH